MLPRLPSKWCRNFNISVFGDAPSYFRVEAGNERNVT